MIGYGAFSGCRSLTSIVIPYSITTIGFGAFFGCNSLTSIVIPDLRTISPSAFEGCTELTTIHAPSFSTTTFFNSPDNLIHLLVKAGFYHKHLEATLDHGRDGCFHHYVGGDMYYNMKLWGREKDKVSGRLPLCTAAERCLTW